MKMKYVSVVSDKGFGIVKHIVLQVEETDSFLTSSGMGVGYKIIIDCTKGNVSAAGGRTFNPYYHEESALCRSKKMTTNESDVLGFYVSNIEDIDLLPDTVDFDKFRDLLATSNRGHRDHLNSFADRIDSMYSDNKLDSDKKYFKSIYRSKRSYNTGREMISEIKSAIDMVIDKDEDDDISGWLTWVAKEGEKWDRNGYLDRELSLEAYFGIIDAESLQKVDELWCSNSKSVIADYLWCRFDPLPQDKWAIFSEKNDLLSYEPLDLLAVTEKES